MQTAASLLKKLAVPDALLGHELGGAVEALQVSQGEGCALEVGGDHADSIYCFPDT